MLAPVESSALDECLTVSLRLPVVDMSPDCKVRIGG